MNVTLALLADYANITSEGKLNILGIFDIIYAQNFPAVHPLMQLVMAFEADRIEAKTTKKIDIYLIDADGKKLVSIGGEITLVEPPPGDIMIRQNHMLIFNNLRFESPGSYEFKILINEEIKVSVPLKVVQLPSQ